MVMSRLIIVLVNFLSTILLPGKGKSDLPNFVIIFCDDLGYGDIGVYGHPTIRTPNVDRLAFEGQKWTSFYNAASVSTPSRAGLLTGRLPVRSGMCNDTIRVSTPNSLGGLPQSEITIAEQLSKAGYISACIGKWHVGHLPQFLPLNNGFDYFEGLPYANGGMTRKVVNGKVIFDIPLMRGNEEIERPVDQSTLTKRYTEAALKFIEQNAGNHFFLYLAHTMPHVPLSRSHDFVDVSLRGLYGDVVEEIDWSVGEIIKKLKDLGIEKNTLVVFTSDNGPWLTQKLNGGSSGILSGEKGDTYEGGFRVPAVFWWPGTIEPDVIMDAGTTMDLFPTFSVLAGIPMPKDRIYDGYDLSKVICGTGKSGRDIVYYYRGTRVFAIRKGAYKAHFVTKSAYGRDDEKKHDPPLLFNLETDPSEKYDIASQHPDVIEDIEKVLEDHLKTLTPVENQLAKTQRVSTVR